MRNLISCAGQCSRQWQFRQSNPAKSAALTVPIGHLRITLGAASAHFSPESSSGGCVLCSPGSS